MGALSFNGRTDGFGYFLGSLSFIAALVVWSIVYGVLSVTLGGGEDSVASMISGIGFMLTLPIALWAFLAGMARRLHDMGASAWWLLVCLPLLPLAGIVLIFTPGQSGENRFGA